MAQSLPVCTCGDPSPCLLWPENRALRLPRLSVTLQLRPILLVCWGAVGTLSSSMSAVPAGVFPSAKVINRPHDVIRIVNNGGASGTGPEGLVPEFGPKLIHLRQYL